MKGRKPWKRLTVKCTLVNKALLNNNKKKTVTCSQQWVSCFKFLFLIMKLVCGIILQMTTQKPQIHLSGHEMGINML